MRTFTPKTSIAHNHNKMKKAILTFAAVVAAFVASADEGMWLLPYLQKMNIKDMKAKGCRLSAEDIYSVNKSSLKDAIIIFGGGCTGEIVSDKGLIFTNHHCGYGSIQQLSSVENDYLKYGFWASSYGEELPVPGLSVRFVRSIEDVTDQIIGNVPSIAGEQERNKIIGENTRALTEKLQAENEGKTIQILPFFGGNQYFAFVFDIFRDVRLVGTPPSSIGKFGGDTDNWIWPRHTGDFSVFRIYAGPDNEPAAYAAGNVPYRPARHFAISTRGVREGDFTMIYGFPGNTQQYILSDVVKYIQECSDPMKIAIRTARLDRIAEAQRSDPALRIHYAARHANIANAWKKWQGEVLGLKKLDTYRRKREAEALFVRAMADEGHGEYRGVLDELRREFARALPYYYTRELLAETLRTVDYAYSAEERNDPLFARRRPVERALYELVFEEYAARNTKLPVIPEFEAGVARCGSVRAYADRIFDLAADDPSAGELAALKAGIERLGREIVEQLGTSSLRNFASTRMNALYADYVAGLRRWAALRGCEGDLFPDANLTLRVAYGSVAGYAYADGEYHEPQTTLDGIIAKDDPSVYDYDIPQALRDLHAAKDYGRWATEVNGRRTVPVCFLATNQTTGGNSGSPILDAEGRLVGINFDRTWRSTMSDIEFDPAICRNISVDIRYVLFVMDRIGGVSYLFDEMRID